MCVCVCFWEKDCYGYQSPWTDCTSCVNGTQTSVYTIVHYEENGGLPCPFYNGQILSQSCGTDNCGNLLLFPQKDF